MFSNDTWYLKIRIHYNWGYIFRSFQKAATEFSFFKVIPTILGATIFDIANNGNLFLDNITPIFIGFITAFMAALIVVVKFVEFIRRFGFAPLLVIIELFLEQLFYFYIFGSGGGI